MPLPADARLGPYEIPAAIAAGGASRNAFQSTAQPRSYDIAPDGRFMFVRNVDGQAPINLVVAVNWLEELKQRVPTN